MKFDDLIFFILGSLSIFNGLDVFSSPIQKFVSFGVINVGPHHQLYGATLMVFGAACICSVLRNIILK